MLQIALEIVFYVAIINSHIHPIHEATYYASCYCRAGRLSRYWRCHWNRHGSKAQYDQDAITCQLCLAIITVRFLTLKLLI